MALNETVIPASRDEVWSVLSDAACYPQWVVGARKFRESDPDFPAVGSKFHHQVGVFPFTLNDNTEVLELDPPRFIALAARGRPFGTARVELGLADHPQGTRVTMVEHGRDVFTKMMTENPIGGRLLHRRNEVALDRLKRLVEQRRNDS